MSFTSSSKHGSSDEFKNVVLEESIADCSTPTFETVSSLGISNSQVTQQESLYTRITALALHLYQTIVVDWILRQKPLPPSPDGRHIPLREPSTQCTTLIDARTGQPYIRNSIRSARYTPYDFLPKQLFFQATRLNNVYFLAVSVPQTIPGVSTTGNFTTILPLLFFMGLTMAKEGWDDWRRHRMDGFENRRLAIVLKERSAEQGFGRKHSFWSLWAREQEQKPPVNEEDEDAQWANVQWQQIKVGDVIRLSRDDAVPADIVLLATDHENGFAYIETMALDGETNLKTRQAPSVLQTCQSIGGLKSCRTTFVLEDPNPNLYEFNGRFTIDDKTHPLTLTNAVFRGSVLRNTGFAIGLVVNTGEECKIRMNANQHPRAKKPRLESYSNKIVLTLAAYVIVLTAGLSCGYVLWQRQTERKSWYLKDAMVSMQDIIVGFAIEFNNVVPLSLYVSLEIVKLGQMLLLNSDVEMYDEESDMPAVCNTNTILENLGQVDYVLSDKTGTLTENVMKLRKTSVLGDVWIHKGIADSVSTIPTTKKAEKQRANLADENTTSYMSALTRQDLEQEFAQRAREFLLAMALCHTCLPEVVDDQLTYQGSSPDELALVKAAQELGFEVISRTMDSITLLVSTINGQEEEKYDILDVIEFSSKRKRMSVVLQCPTGRIWLICKGADNIIMPRLELAHLAKKKEEEVRKSLQASMVLRRQEEARRTVDLTESIISIMEGQSSRSLLFSNTELEKQNKPVIPPDGSLPTDSLIFTNTFTHLDSFAEEGLRTLLFADKYLSDDEYIHWKEIYLSATTALTDRQNRIEEAAELIEQSLQLLGTTAIEDKLQKGVPETVDKLRRANIKIWMLTGDKRETAINIAHSAGICKPSSEIFTLDANNGNMMHQILAMRTLLYSAGHSVAVIDGHTLAAIDSDPDASKVFYNAISHVDSIICSRASPAQKASIVASIRRYNPNALTLAIGDGANDVAMIQASHVGVGISGREGLQAARVADYSIAQFRFLQRLLLVHGRWNYVRTTKFILMTFWKEFFFYMMQAVYQQYSGYTGTSLYEQWSLTVLNTLFTSLCVITMGMFEQDLAADTLIAVPELYVYGQRNKGLYAGKYLRWVLGATIQGILGYFIVYVAYGLVIVRDSGLFATGDLCFSLGIMWTNYKLFLIEMHNKTTITLTCFVITVTGWWMWNVFLSQVYTFTPSPYAVANGFVMTFGRDPVWWLTLVLSISILVGTEVAWKTCKRSLKSGKVWFVKWTGTQSESHLELDLDVWQKIERDPAWKRNTHHINSDLGDTP